MSSKVSALSAATTFSATDVTYTPQGSPGKKVTRDVFLTANSGEAVNFFSGGLAFGYDASGNGQINIAGSKQFNLFYNFASCLSFDGSGNLVAHGAAGATTTISGNGSSLVIDGSGNFTVSLAGGAVLALPYVAANPANWAGGVPATDQWAANDRFAAALTAAGFAP